MYRASNKCKKEKRKTINGDDLLWAMSLLGYEHYIDHLRGYLLRYREVIVFPKFHMFSAIWTCLLTICFYSFFLFHFGVSRCSGMIELVQIEVSYNYLDDMFN